MIGLISCTNLHSTVKWGEKIGGRSASSGVETFGRKMGTRFTPKQYKDAVSDQANFILQELTPQIPKQLIIKKSFKGNTAQVILEAGEGGTLTAQTTAELNSLELLVYGKLEESKREKKNSRTWSEYGIARARTQLYKNVLDDIKRLLKNK